MRGSLAHRILRSYQQINLPQNDQQEDLLNRVHRITGQIAQDREDVQDRIYQSQQRQKKRFDQTIKQVQYKIGDLVLLYKSQLRGKQKLEERWTGPYYIHEVLPNGAYKLRTMNENKVLKTPVNGERLKLYHARN